MSTKIFLLMLPKRPAEDQVEPPGQVAVLADSSSLEKTPSRKEIVPKVVDGQSGLSLTAEKLGCKPCILGLFGALGASKIATPLQPQKDIWEITLLQGHPAA